MKTKYITYFILVFVAISSFISCNDDDENTYVDEAASRNAFISSFSLEGTAIDANDSITYPILKKTAFAIDHIRKVIYNPDSLPYETRLAKFKPAITLAETSSYIDIVYPDTTVRWNSEDNDSIDFTKDVILSIVPPAGTAYKKDYTVQLNIHKFDPDTLDWMNVASLPIAANVLLKALAVGENIVVYTLSGSEINMFVSPIGNIGWSNATLTSLPTDTRLSNILLFENKLLAVTEEGKSYVADTTDPATWTLEEGHGMKVHNLLGVLPAKVETDDVVLVAVNDNGQYKFGKTKDFSSIEIVDAVDGYPEAIIPIDENFPSFGFSSSTNYNRESVSENILILSGGTDFNNTQIADSWLIKLNKTDGLQASSVRYGIGGHPFNVADDFKAFVYDEKLYATTNDSLYTSVWGMNWVKAPQKQQFVPEIKTTKNQSVVVDKNKFVWIIGSETNSGQVWRGRLNRLAQKIR